MQYWSVCENGRLLKNILDGTLFTLKTSCIEDLPDGFRHVQEGHAVAVVCAEGAEKIAGALLHNAGCETLSVIGRGAMFRFAWMAERNGIVRRCKRGGLMRFLFRDQYLFVNRPYKEFKLHLCVLQRGLPAPGLLGVCWRRRGLCYSGSLATEELPGVDLDAWLRDNQVDSAAGASLLRACGKLIRTMHEAGVLHADLQLKNLFVSGNAVFLLDFDRARIKTRIANWRRACNLLRLRRSFDKRGHGREAFRMLAEGYGMTEFDPLLDGIFKLKGFLSTMFFERRRT